jgi:hypothetical protein
MLRTLLTGAALSAVIAIGSASGAAAQPPSPGEIVHKVDRGVRHAVTDVDHTIRHRGRRTHRVVRHSIVRTSRYRVRALCNDGRFHTGRTGFSACAAHGGLR